MPRWLITHSAQFAYYTAETQTDAVLQFAIEHPDTAREILRIEEVPEQPAARPAEARARRDDAT